MRERLIIIKPYELQDLLEVKIEKEINEHARAKVVGHIDEGLEDKYVNMAQEHDGISIEAKDEKGSTKVLFKGRVDDIKIDTDGQVRRLEITAVSTSYFLDVEEKTRTFQNEAQAYSDIVKTVEGGYGSTQVYMSVGDGKTTGRIFVQYKETDWEFLKRLASHFNSFLVPECTKDGTKIYFGPVLQNSEHTLKEISYKAIRDVSEYLYKHENKVKGISEVDCIGYEVTTRSLLDICAHVTFKGKNLVVAKAVTQLVGSELVNTYLLKSKAGMQVPVTYNEKMIGASLDGKVIDVMQDVVKVHVLVDKAQDKGTAKWFPYSTVYSSPDGTGWYCMPEIGDKMRIYFPSEREEEAFAISSVHLEASNSASRSNPNHKCLSTKYGKCILFKEDELLISNGHGSYIRLKDDSGIEMVTDKKFTINADEDVVIHSEEKLYTSAPKSVEFEQSGSKITVKKNITFKGGEVKIKE